MRENAVRTSKGKETSTHRGILPCHAPALPLEKAAKEMSLLTGRLGIVFGVANRRSIAWAIAQAWHEAGAKLAFSYQGERLKENVEDLVSGVGPDTRRYPCGVTRDEDIAPVFEQVGKDFGKLHVLLHSVAFAPKEAL